MTIADAAIVADIHTRTWQQAYRGIVADSYLDGLAASREASTWRERIAKPGLGVRHVVFESALHGLVGIASAGPDRLAADWSDDQSGQSHVQRSALWLVRAAG